MVTKEIGSVKGLLAIFREEDSSLEELKKDLDTFDKEKLIDYVISSLEITGDDDDDY